MRKVEASDGLKYRVSNNGLSKWLTVSCGQSPTWDGVLVEFEERLGVGLVFASVTVDTSADDDGADDANGGVEDIPSVLQNEVLVYDNHPDFDCDPSRLDVTESSQALRSALNMKAIQALFGSSTQACAH